MVSVNWVSTRLDTPWLDAIRHHIFIEVIQTGVEMYRIPQDLSYITGLFATVNVDGRPTPLCVNAGGVTPNHAMVLIIVTYW